MCTECVTFDTCPRENYLSTPPNMSNQNISPQESSHFLLSELNDSNSSFEKDEEGSSRTSTNPSGSGEKMSKPVDEETEEEYEQIATNKILAIKSEVEDIQRQISEYSKEQLQEEFKILEEILIQKTLTLDDIDSKAIESVRELRKNTIRFVQDCLKEMDTKLK